MISCPAPTASVSPGANFGRKPALYPGFLPKFARGDGAGGHPRDVRNGLVTFLPTFPAQRKPTPSKRMFNR